MKSLANRKFDETVEVAFRLGVDPRKADQMLRGTVSLPAGTGKDVRVAVFAAGDAAREARGGRRRRRRRRRSRRPGRRSGFLDFDVAIATPDLMGQVGKLGRVLGPRGLMPNPKTGTVTTDVGKTVAEFKGGKVEYRTDRYGNVHVPIGKVELPGRRLVTNYGAVLDEISGPSPPSAKGQYLKGDHDVVDDGPRREDPPDSRGRSALRAARDDRTRPRGRVVAEPAEADARRSVPERQSARHAGRGTGSAEPVAVAAHRASTAGRAATSMLDAARRRASRRTAERLVAVA